MDVRLIELALPLRQPLSTAATTIEERRVVLVGLIDGDLTGWGEAAPYPGVTPDTVDGAWNSLTGALATTPSAAAALEEAEADLRARADGVPLWSALGGSRRPLATSVAVGLDEDPVERVASTGAAGVKLKIRPGEDIDRVEQVRASYPELAIGVDADGAYGWDRRDSLLDLDRFDVAYVEQPFPPEDLDSHAAVRAELLADVVVDEPIGNMNAALEAIEADAADVIAVKPGRIGLGACRIVHDLALTVGLRVKVSGLVETAVGRAHALAVAMLPGTTYSDVADDAWFFGGSTGTPGFAVTNGWISAPEGHGIGIDPDFEALASSVVREERFTRPAGPDPG